MIPVFGVTVVSWHSREVSYHIIRVRKRSRAGQATHEHRIRPMHSIVDGVLLFKAPVTYPPLCCPPLHAFRGGGGSVRYDTGFRSHCCTGTFCGVCCCNTSLNYASFVRYRTVYRLDQLPPHSWDLRTRQGLHTQNVFSNNSFFFAFSTPPPSSLLFGRVQVIVMGRGDTRTTKGKRMR